MKSDMKSEFSQELINMAGHGETLPEGLDMTDAQCYLALRNMYRAFWANVITKEQAQAEKKQILDAWEADKKKANSMYEVADFYRRIELPATEFKKNPTVENGIKLWESIYKIKW